MKARVTKDRVTIICPACRVRELLQGYTDPADGGVAGEHTVPYRGPNAWSFNGDIAHPTLAPSLLLTHELKTERFVCHSFVRFGMIEYLTDCTHELAGKTVALPDFP